MEDKNYEIGKKEMLMSRSFKIPRFHDSGEGKKYSKNRASRKVRHSKIISNGGFYKKLYEQWNIIDCKSGWYSRRELYNWLVKMYKNPGYWEQKKSFWERFYNNITK